ncbi:MAG: chemotaxis response regulator protein-glutamate methylesterase [Treponema sp.]|nr:chemotaxis response regulator protein-glutamate methylesterase [Treponema sp.]MBR6193601.1 chemotaxis response regulator protein-glutamate methylesterase [Treponema sp.]
MDDISVLVCDDSALMRNLISRIVNGTEGMSTVGTAMNGKFCLQKIPTLKPDVILLDIEMPEMNGIQFLEERKLQGIDIPVIVLSSIAVKGASVTMKCLELGASDFITKPNGAISTNIATVANKIIENIASYGGRYARRKGKDVGQFDFFMHQAKMKEAEAASKAEGIEDKVKPLSSMSSSSAGDVSSFRPSLWKPSKPKEPVVITPLRNPGRVDVVAIGISTGGPNALREMFAKIPEKFPKPILVVQHMPAGFTKEFAASLDRICPLSVKEAEDGDLIHPGQIYVAPGDYHIVVEKSSLCNVIRLEQSALRNGHRPSADVLFESVAKIYQNRALGVIMTGMGRDGAAQLAEMRKQGAWTLGQDEKSCIVYGMPKVAYEMGGVQKQVSLDDMAAEIVRVVENS